ncbi:EamA-like transporter family protein [Devosia lucknowensis]|uniref:EamA-like transporter family protein n=1 Tax=Devosia lucknowensis TaxID=1096929 RepID=A0A1Y6G9S8_9HYPH|nr:DMT family transporter [Devosia lucknowensis]SMQ86143.1 EamA-like transporter family protein [Devosia lucknowensis]
MTTPAPAHSSTSIDSVGFGLALAGAALFSTKGIFIKLAFAEGVSTEAALALRMLVALPVYLVILVSLMRRNPQLRPLLTPGRLAATMAVGALGYYLSSYLDFAGLAFVSAQYERLVLFTYPFFVLLFGVWFFGDRMNWNLVPAMLLSYGGLLVIFAWNLTVRPDGLLLGTTLVLGSALTFALYQHFAKRQMLAIGSALFTCIGMSTAAVLAIGQSLVVDGPSTYATFSPYVWFLGLMLGVFGTVLPSFLLNGAIARIGPRATSSTASFGPIITIVLAVFILGEEFTWIHALGTAMVLLGSWWFARRETRNRAAAEEPS